MERFFNVGDFIAEETCLYALMKAEFLGNGGRSVMDTEKAEEKAIRKRVKSRRYSGKYKGRGKYKPKDPA
jgi:hypothetical protein